MMTRLLPLLFALVTAFSTGQVSAVEIRGKVKELDGEKGTITLTVGEADRTFLIASDAKVVGLYGKKLKKATVQGVPGGLRGVKEGSDVTLTTATKEDRTTVSQVKVEDLQAKLRKKAKKKAK